MKQALSEVRRLSEIPRTGIIFNCECSHKGGGNQTLALCKYALLPTEPSPVWSVVVSCCGCLPYWHFNPGPQACWSSVLLLS